MATLIRAAGGVEEVTPAGKVFTLEELQALVGGYIEAVATPEGRLMYVNEDGKHLQLPVNKEATARVRHWLTPGDVIVGDVVLCSLQETVEPNTHEETEPC